MHSPNTEQEAAVTSRWPRTIVVAGPGSGKTRVLVERVRWLIGTVGVDSGAVCVLTFTNAGAGEFKRRLEGVKLGYCGTLHSFLLKLLQEHGRLVGLQSPVSVVDDDAQADVLQSILEDVGSKASMKKLQAMLALPPLIDGTPGMSRTKEELAVVEFHRRLRRAGLITFDTILHYGYKLIKELATHSHGTAGHWPYEWLLVDEVQDSSDADWRIYEAFDADGKFLVGDPDQSVYGFRGGNVGNMVAASVFGGRWEVFRLQNNYRCRQAICARAEALIQLNGSRVDKRTVGMQEGGEVNVIACDSPVIEMARVVAEVRDEIIGGRTVAVVARTNWLAKQHAEFLQARGVQVATAEVPKVPVDWKAAKLLLTALANPHNTLAVHAYLVAKQGKASADRQKDRAFKQMMSLHLSVPELQRESISAVELSHLSHESKQRIHDACRQLDEGWTLNDLLAYLHSGEQRVPEGDGVVVTTAHQSKGREFDCVFVVGCEEGLFPQAKKDTDLEEERRLMYVAMTRARHRLVLTWCRERPQRRGPDMPPGPVEARQVSQFLKEDA